MQATLPFELTVVPARRARSRSGDPARCRTHDRTRDRVCPASSGAPLPDPRRGRWNRARDAAAMGIQARGGGVRGSGAGWIEKQRRRRELEREQLRAAPIPPALELELRQRATRELPARLLELAAAHGLRVSRVSVRNQRWRWGSCSRSGHICLNWRLVPMPPPVRDYVLIHELMHLKRMDHSPAFWRLVAEVCPDFSAARAWLRKHGRGSTTACHGDVP